MERGVKTKLINLFVWIINKIDKNHIKKMSINKKLEVDFSFLIPNDDKWHSYTASIQYWLKLDEDCVEEKRVFVDGVEIKQGKELFLKIKT